MTPQYILRKSLCRPAFCSDDYVKWRANEIEDMTYAASYVEPGYSHPNKGILFANWNYFPRGIDSLLERYGYSVEWSDEWATCDNCNRAVRTQPDNWGWTPSYVIENDYEVICTQCKAQSERA